MQFSEYAEDPLESKRHAVQRLANLLKHPDDLHFKLENIRSKLTQEKMLTDAQLNADVQRQFDDVQDGLDLLSSTNDQIELAKNEMKLIDSLCHEAQNFLTNYDRIKKISVVHKNFEQTEMFYKKFLGFNEQCKHVESLLSAALTNFDKFDFNILIMHYHINQLEKFREQALSLTESCDEDVKHTLTELFSEFVELREKFEQFIWDLSCKLYELGAEQKYNIIIHLVKVIETEEENDSAILKEEANKKHAGSLSSATNNSSNYFSNSNVNHNKKFIRNYKDKFFKVIEKIVKNRMDDFFTQIIEDIDDIGKTTDVIIDDMHFISENIVPCAPRYYKLFDFFLAQYHTSVLAKVNEIISQELEGKSILNILRLTREYQVLMKKELGVTKDKLVPPLLEGREESMITEYLTLVKSKVTEWITNLMKTETKEFLERIEPPELGEGNRYTMQGSIIMFEIVNQQVDLAIESNRGKLVCDVMFECNKVFSQSNKQWKNILQAETLSQIERPQETEEGLVEYTLALANDQLRCVEFAEGIQTRLCEQLSRTFQDKLSTEIGSAMEGFMDVAQSAVSSLSDIVFNDLRPVTSLLYASEWYSDDLIIPIIETLQDYTNDFKANLHEFLFIRLMQDMLERIFVAYIDAVKSKSAKFAIKTSISKLKTTASQINIFFKKYMDHLAVAEAYNTFLSFISLIEASPAMIFLEYFSIKKNYPDIPLELVKDILAKRADIEKSEMRKIMESLKEKSNADTHLIGKRHSLFSKLTNY
ncbi:hypothetical protein BB561_002615 [Smittium simulii]|uniref:Uncharacterized protein n=1 Tax=Smittium simulii TaxID=133385 RepID=A0A2T9YPS6_9FUNG|nr:hypothetical protein BB561_002615 [Smittium simulii]